MSFPWAEPDVSPWDEETLARLSAPDRARLVRRWLEDPAVTIDWRMACDALCASEIPARDRSFLVSLLRRSGELPPSSPRLRVAITGTGTLGPLVDLLRCRLVAEGFSSDVHVGQFGQMHFELRKPEAFWPWREPPSAVLVGIDVGGVLPDRTGVDLPSDAGHVRADEALADLAEALRAFRSRYPIPVFVNNLPPIASGFQGVHEGSDQRGTRPLIGRFNEGLAALARSEPDVFVLDLCGLAAELGGLRFFDARRWYYARMPCSYDGFTEWACEAASAIATFARGPRKCIAVDLDDTLWGGILGEVGPRGIELGQEGLGLAYRDFQAELRRIRRQGVLLAAASKNDPPMVDQVFEQNPQMVLCRDDFVAMETNWEDKSANIRRIAADLGIGLDSVIFLDDSPQERSLVRWELPDVLTPVLPADPVDRPRFLRKLRAWRPLRSTAEDGKRTEYYRMRAASRAHAEAHGSAAAFLLSLRQTLQFKRVEPAELPRLAQMHERTNQFNLTTRRLTAAELADLLNRREFRLYIGQVSDRFGDHGHVIAAVVRVLPGAADGPDPGGVWEIESFLMSCRVIGRVVETAFLQELLREARRSKARHVVARFVPTERNTVAAAFLAAHRFERIADARDAVDGGSTWRLDLETPLAAGPEVVQVTSLAASRDAS